MHDTLATVTIETKNGPVIINKSDYCEKKHKLVGAEKTAKAKKPVEKKPAKKPAKKEETPELFVVPNKGGNFVIVDKDGKQQGKDAYKSEEDAKAALK